MRLVRELSTKHVNSNFPPLDALAPKKWMEIPVFGFFFLYIASLLRGRKKIPLPTIRLLSVASFYA